MCHPRSTNAVLPQQHPRMGGIWCTLLTCLAAVGMSGSSVAQSPSAWRFGTPAPIPATEVLEGAVNAGLLAKDYQDGQIDDAAHARAQAVNASTAAGKATGALVGFYVGGALGGIAGTLELPLVGTVAGADVGAVVGAAIGSVAGGYLGGWAGGVAFDWYGY